MANSLENSTTLNKESILQVINPEVFTRWKTLGKDGLRIPEDFLKKIENTSSSDTERFSMMIDGWVQGIGRPPSWRMLIYALDKIFCTEAANACMMYAEPQQDDTLTVDDAVRVMSLMEPKCVRAVWDHLGVSPARFSTHAKDSNVTSDVVKGCEYYVKYHPNSVSWDTLQATLYQLHAKASMDLLLSFKGRTPNREGDTLTVENVAPVLRHCQRAVVATLIPEEQLQMEYDSTERCFQEGALYYIKYNPQSSWRDIATTLYYCDDGRGSDSSLYEKRVKPYLPLKASSLTVPNLTRCLSEVSNKEWDDLCHALGFPVQKIEFIKSNIKNAEKQRKIFLDLYTTEYPVPSWNHLCASLRQVGCTKLANKISTEFCLTEVADQATLPIICNSPEDISKIPGEPAVFSVSIKAPKHFEVHWMKDGEKMDEKDSKTCILKIAACKSEDVGTYKCVVSTEAGSVQSRSAKLSVLDTRFGQVSLAREGYTSIDHTPYCIVYAPECEANASVCLRGVVQETLELPCSEADIRITPFIHISPRKTPSTCDKPLIIDLMTTVELSFEPECLHLYICAEDDISKPLNWKKHKLNKTSMLKDRVSFETKIFGCFVAVAHLSSTTATITLQPKSTESDSGVAELKFPEISGLTVNIPNNSIKSDSPIQVKATAYFCDPMSAMEQNSTTIATPCISLTPHGLELVQNVTVNFPIPDWEEIKRDHPDIELQLWYNPGEAESLSNWSLNEDTPITIIKDNGNCIAQISISHFSSAVGRWSRSIKRRMSKIFTRVRSIKRKRQVFMTKETDVDQNTISFGIAVKILPFEGQSRRPPLGYNHYKLSDSEDGAIEFNCRESSFNTQVKLLDRLFPNALTEHLTQEVTTQLPEDLDDVKQVEFLFQLPSTTLLEMGVLGQLTITQTLNDSCRTVDRCNLILNRCTYTHSTSFSSVSSMDSDSSLSASGSLKFDVHKIYNAIYSVRPNWYNLGLALDVDLPTLDAIECNGNDPKSALRKVIVHWLKTHVPDPEKVWSILAEALRSQTVGESHLASELLKIDEPPLKTCWRRSIDETCWAKS